MSDRGKIVFENGSDAFIPAPDRDAEMSRKALKSAYPRCHVCEVRLNRWTFHKPWCERAKT